MIGGILFLVIEAKLDKPSNNNLAQLFLELLCASSSPWSMCTHTEHSTAAAKVNKQADFEGLLSVSQRRFYHLDGICWIWDRRSKRKTDAGLWELHRHVPHVLRVYGVLTNLNRVSFYSYNPILSRWWNPRWDTPRQFIIKYDTWYVLCFVKVSESLCSYSQLSIRFLALYYLPSSKGCVQ